MGWRHPQALAFNHHHDHDDDHHYQQHQHNGVKKSDEYAPPFSLSARTDGMRPAPSFPRLCSLRPPRPRFPPLGLIDGFRSSWRACMNKITTVSHHKTNGKNTHTQSGREKTPLSNKERTHATATTITATTTSYVLKLVGRLVRQPVGAVRQGRHRQEAALVQGQALSKYVSK